MLIPDQPGPYPRLLTAAGKEGKVYWVNRDIMTAGNNHYNQKGSSDAVLQTLSLGGGVYSTPAYFNGRVYWAASGDVLASFPITNGLMGNYTAGTRTFPYPGATPSISANGTSNGVVWAVQRSDPAVLVAYDATNLTTPLYDSSQAGTRDQLANGVKFALPTIANGKVYVGGQYAVSVLGLLGVPRAVWRRAHFGTNTNANVAGDFGDPDQDRMPNVFAYAMGTDPKQANTSPFTGQMKTDEFEVSFRRNLSASDIGVTLQESADPAGPWTNVVSYSAGAGWAANGSGVAVTESAAAGAPPDQFVVVSIAQAVDPGRPNAFYRLRLTL